MSDKPKILAVDDKRENLIAIQTVLKDMPVEIITALSGNEALQLTLHHEFVLALLDIQMPEMDGFELAEILQNDEKTAHLPFIFISAVYTDNLNIFKGYEKGAFGFITKPFQPRILMNKVKFFVDKHRQEMALHNLNKELESFSYSISHDLRAPLRAINGFSHILKEDQYDTFNDDSKEALDMIITNAKRMEHLIDDLLDFSKLGKKQIIKSQVNIDELVKSVLLDLGMSSQKETSFDIQPLGDALGDRALLRQALFNLISNAIKYSSKKEKPRVEIGSEKKTYEVIYYVKDNGAGFNMNYYDRLFQVFQRLHNLRDYEGTGVGLAIVQRIISKHGGRVWAEGKENEGATFYFSLPLTTE